MRWPGVEPGSTAWKAAMLTAIPPTLAIYIIYVIQLMLELLRCGNDTTFKRINCSLLLSSMTCNFVVTM